MHNCSAVTLTKSACRQTPVTAISQHIISALVIATLVLIIWNNLPDFRRTTKQLVSCMREKSLVMHKYPSTEDMNISCPGWLPQPCLSITISRAIQWPIHLGTCTQCNNCTLPVKCGGKKVCFVNSVCISLPVSLPPPFPPCISFFIPLPRRWWCLMTLVKNRRLGKQWIWCQQTPSASTMWPTSSTCSGPALCRSSWPLFSCGWSWDPLYWRDWLSWC